jgi:hypothetical protein
MHGGGGEIGLTAAASDLLQLRRCAAAKFESGRREHV